MTYPRTHGQCEGQRPVGQGHREGQVGEGWKPARALFTLQTGLSSAHLWSNLNPSCCQSFPLPSSCYALSLLVSGPLTLASLSNPLIIFAVRYPHPPQGGSCSVGVYTPKYALHTFTHVCHQKLWTRQGRHQILPPPLRERGPESSPPAAPGQTLLRIFSVLGRGREEKINTPGAKQHQLH